jgi:nucleoid-associated protein YgaU
MADYGMFATVYGGRNRVNNTILPKTYTVVKGDTIYKIARKLYGDGALWEQVVTRNRNVISNPCLIRPGMILKV